MTAIAGLVDEGVVWIGGDSAGVAGLSLGLRRDPKVFLVEDYILGYTSSFRMGQVLRYYFTPSLPDEGQEPHEYMVLKFVPEVRRLLKAHGFLQTSDGREEIGTFLVGWRGRIFVVHDDLQVAELLQPYAACGCGHDLVLGSLHTTEQLTGLTARERIELALDAAETFSAGVRRPFTILRTP